jgi:glycosyltransferase involved in cell wall biosynthesis
VLCLPRAPEARLKVLIVTDAWAPQVNGVVRTLEMLGQELRALGHEVVYATPEGRTSVPLPTYPEIRLALFPRRSLEQLIAEFAPDAIHVATEGTMGLSARAICLRRKLPFSTAYHTRFPEYVNARFPFISENMVYRFLRWFHGPATAVMVPTQGLRRELEAHGFTNVRIWSRGVDVDAFHPDAEVTLPYPRPVWLYVGRIAIEKNIEAFLSLDLPGSKVVVGDGPARAMLTEKFPDAQFLGARFGADLARHYAAADVVVFPSKTETFGLVMLEAFACGTPVAAYPVEAPLNLVGDAPVAALDNDLKTACLKALAIGKNGGANLTPRSFALQHSWRACAQQFLANVAEEPDV